MDFCKTNEQPPRIVPLTKIILLRIVRWICTIQEPINSTAGTGKLPTLSSQRPQHIRAKCVRNVLLRTHWGLDQETTHKGSWGIPCVYWGTSGCRRQPNCGTSVTELSIGFLSVDDRIAWQVQGRIQLTCSMSKCAYRLDVFLLHFQVSNMRIVGWDCFVISHVSAIQSTHLWYIQGVMCDAR